MPSRVVRSIIRTASVRASIFESFLMHLVPSEATRSVTPTSSTERGGEWGRCASLAAVTDPDRTGNADVMAMPASYELDSATAGRAWFRLVRCGPRGTREIMIALGLSALGWGLAGVGVRAALGEGVEPLSMVVVHAGIVALAVLVMLWVRRERIPSDRQFWRTATVAGLFNMAVPFALFTTAYQYASAGFVGLLAALMPLSTAIVAHYTVHDEPLTAPKLLGMLVALAGVVLLFVSGDSGLNKGEDPSSPLPSGWGR